MGRNEGHIIQAQGGLDLTGGMWFFTEWFRFWVTAGGGGGVGDRPAGIQSLEGGVRVLRIIHVPVSPVSGDDILNELE